MTMATNNVIRAGSLRQISSIVATGMSISHGDMLNVDCRASDMVAICPVVSDVCCRLTVRNTTSAMISEGTVVIIIYLIWSKSGTCDVDDASTVVSERADILSPK